jgi:hypothetical protein
MAADLVPSVLAPVDAVAQECDGDELAYLALTGKIEGRVRDRLAWRLHQSLTDGYQFAREWRRVDLAVLSGGHPRLLVELKAFCGFNIIGKKNAPAEYLEALRRDLAKVAGLHVDGLFMAVIADTTLTGPVPDRLVGTVKYLADIQKHTNHPSDDEVQHFIEAVPGRLIGLPRIEGKAADVPVRVRLAVWTVE